MPIKGLTSNTLLFDIETEGLRAEQSSVLSIAYQKLEDQGQPTGLYAKPEPGTFISKWSENKVWEKIKPFASQHQTEQEILGRFLKVLQANEGGILAGWNIGYSTVPQSLDDPRMRGFDIPFLMTRAEKYGMGEQYREAIQKMQIRDIGQEYAAKVSEIVSKPRYKGIVDPDIWEQAKGFRKALARTGLDQTTEGLSADAASRLLQQQARQASIGGYKFAGWKLETIHELMGLGQFGSHEAGADVSAMRRVIESTGALAGKDELAFVQQWNKSALTNKLLASARYDTTPLSELQAYARKAGIQVEGEGGLTAKIEDLARASGATLEDVGMGRGIPEVFTRVGEEQFTARPAASKVGGFAQRAATHITRHKLGYGIAAGAALLWMAKPLSIFSGKDDNYNTIEGLRHGGFAERMRLEMTDFGSGYKGPKDLVDKVVRAKEEAKSREIEKKKKKALRRRRGYVRHEEKTGKTQLVRQTSVRAPNYFSGRDDVYNTIEGMSHKGIAGATRKHRTDFGSGYQGLHPELQEEYNLAEEIPQYQLFRASKLGLSEKEMYAYLTKKEEPSEYLAATASAGTAIHKLMQAQMVNRGEVDKVEQFLYDPETKVTGHADIVLPGNVPADIKTVNAKIYAERKAKGAAPKNISQVNFYANMMGAEKFQIQYVNRDDPTQQFTTTHTTDPELYRRDIARLRKVRERIEADVASGRLNAATLPKGASLETLRKDSAAHDTPLNEAELQKVVNDELAYLRKVRRQVFHATTHNRFSGKDDAYNTIEGKNKVLTEGQLQSPENHPNAGDIPKIQYGYNDFSGMPHGWFGEQRKYNTDFGSKWDMLRGLTRAGETFEKMIGGAEFKTALKAAVQGERLGEKGAWGEVFKMTTQFRGKEVQFARKMGAIGKYEIEAQRAAQETIAPTVYGYTPRPDVKGVMERSPDKSIGVGQLDMELFQGQTLRQQYTQRFEQQWAKEEVVPDISDLGPMPEKGMGRMKYEAERKMRKMTMHAERVKQANITIEERASKAKQSIQQQFPSWEARDVNPSNIMYIPKPEGGYHIGAIDFGQWRPAALKPQEFKSFSSAVIPSPVAQSTITSANDRAVLQRGATAQLFQNARGGHAHALGKKY